MRAVISTVPRPAQPNCQTHNPREAMAAGVQKGSFVILFLSEVVLERPQGSMQQVYTRSRISQSRPDGSQYKDSTVGLKTRASMQ